MRPNINIQTELQIQNDLRKVIEDSKNIVKSAFESEDVKHLIRMLEKRFINHKQALYVVINTIITTPGFNGLPKEEKIKTLQKNLNKLKKRSPPTSTTPPPSSTTPPPSSTTPPPSSTTPPPLTSRSNPPPPQETAQRFTYSTAAASSIARNFADSYDEGEDSELSMLIPHAESAAASISESMRQAHRELGGGVQTPSASYSQPQPSVPPAPEIDNRQSEYLWHNIRRLNI